ncbi:FAD-dependent oxidoreductase [Streptomyces paromomycinus]|uniref:FAD-dependent oxidoreductase n=1 Tax=Streptomyces paromomycinus TaxID=92743 RepID=A0A401W4G4_STREY|nr:FAD-dependent oxidoreductase [Streptomyces paromomycinus]
MYGVVIAGAGPVGLFLANELALADCSVVVLERDADPHPPLKALPLGLHGLNAASAETFSRRACSSPCCKRRASAPPPSAPIPTRPRPPLPEAWATSPGSRWTPRTSTRKRWSTGFPDLRWTAW